MARQLAQSSPRRKAQNSVEVASAWLAPLLVLAITDEATDRPSSNSPTASGAHPTNGRGKQTLGQKRIQAELAKLGFKVSARTVAKYMRTARHDRGPSVRWRTFLKLHASNIWACDFFCVQTLLFDTLHVFFVIQHINREVLHVAVTRHPTAEWQAQQILESCAWDRRPRRFMIHDRDSRYGPSFDRRLKRLGIKQVRTPFRCPVANAVAERWVKSARTECLDHLFVFNELTVRRAISSYVGYYNESRTHLSLKKDAPIPRDAQRVGRVVALSILGGLHQRYVRV